MQGQVYRTDYGHTNYEISKHAHHGHSVIILFVKFVFLILLCYKLWTTFISEGAVMF